MFDWISRLFTLKVETPTGEGVFDMRKPDVGGAVRPMNRLNGSSTPLTLVRSSARNRSSSPPSKRQKTFDVIDDSPPHTKASFALDDEHGKKRPRGSSSLPDSQPSYSMTPSMNHSAFGVREFSNLEGTMNPQAKRRRYRTSVSETQGRAGLQERMPALGQSRIEEISDSDDGVALVEPQERPEHPNQKASKDDHVSISSVANRSSNAKGKMKPLETLKEAIDNAEKSPRDPTPKSSPDELSHRPEELRKLGGRRLNPKSLSKRGDIAPTPFNAIPKGSKASAANESSIQFGRHTIIGDGLRMVQGVSGKCQYQKSETGHSLLLSLTSISDKLRPVDKTGQLLKSHAFLTADLGKMTSVYSPSSAGEESCIVVINQSPNGGTSSGAKLAFEFETWGDVAKFLEWCNTQEPKIEIRACPVLKLKKDLVELLNRAPDREVRRDTDPQAEDIQLAQHNQDNRLREKQSNGSKVTAGYSNCTLQPKLIDRLGPSHPSEKSIPQAGTTSRYWEQSTSEQRLFEKPPRRATRNRRPPVEHLSDSDEPQSFPAAWTSLNPGWEQKWRNSIVYPISGTHRATVDKEDIIRLDEGEFLNDNLIIFYLRYLRQQLEEGNPALAERVYFHNTFFYEKLKPSRPSQGINYDSVKSWTSKVDLFSKDYIIVPINEYSHWYVAIIYNAPKLIPPPLVDEEIIDAGRETVIVPDDAEMGRDGLQPAALLGGTSTSNPIVERSSAIAAPIDVSERLMHNTIEKNDDRLPINESDDRGQESRVADETERESGEMERIEPLTSSPIRKKGGKKQVGGLRKYDPNEPRIITLDSLGSAHSPTCKFLKEYLVAELQDKKGIQIDPGSIPGGMTAKDVPQQSNHCDCGLYLLGYIQQLLEDPDRFIQRLLQRDSIPWKLNPPTLRNDIRHLIFDLQRQQQRGEDEAREKKRTAKRKRQDTELPGPIQPSTEVASQSDVVKEKLLTVESQPLRDTIEVEDGLSRSEYDAATRKAPMTPQMPTVDLTQGSSTEISARHDPSPRRSRYFREHLMRDGPDALQPSEPVRSPKEDKKSLATRKDRVLGSPSSANGPVHKGKGATIPGSFPDSADPSPKQGCLSRDAGDSDALAADLIKPLYDSLSSSLSPKGTPQNPLSVDDVEKGEDIIRCTPHSQTAKRKTRIVVEIPSSSHPARLTKSVEDDASSGLPNHERGERMSDIRLTQPSRDIIEVPP